MHRHGRRRAAALTLTTALGAGFLGLVAPAAQAAQQPAVNAPDAIGSGVIALDLPGYTIGLINSDGTGLHSLPNTSDLGMTPNWSEDGSRLAAGWSQITSYRLDGTQAITTPWATGLRSSGSYNNPVYWENGGYILFDSAGQLVVGPSDGSWAPQPLLSSAQEPAGVCDSHPSTAPDNVVVFTRGCNAGTAVWSWNPATNRLAQLIPDASAPVFSADGTRIAFSRDVDGVSQLFSAFADGSHVVQLTSEPEGAADPSWEPADDARIAYDTAGPSGNEVKVLTVATGTATVLTTDGSHPSWQPLRTNSIVRLYGTGGLGTDVAGARWDYKGVNGKGNPGSTTAWNAVLLNSNDEADAPAAVTLAAEKAGPLLLTSGNALSAATAAELKRSLRRGWTVYLEGGTAQLSPRLAAQVAGLGYHVVRIGAGDPYDESVDTARTITSTPTVLMFADSNDYQEALSAADAVAGTGNRGRWVLVLTNGSTVPAGVEKYVNSLNLQKMTVVGVGSKVTYALEHTRFAKAWQFYPVGTSNSQATAVSLARFWWRDPATVAIGNTSDWRSGTIAGVYTSASGPLVWTGPTYLATVSSVYLQQESSSINTAYLFGWNGYPRDTQWQIGQAMSASPAWTNVYLVPNGSLADPFVQPASVRSALAVTGTAGGSAATVAPSAVPGAPLTVPTGLGPELGRSGS